MTNRGLVWPATRKFRNNKIGIKGNPQYVAAILFNPMPAQRVSKVWSV